MKKSEHIQEYYKNLCEKLNERVNLLEKILNKKKIEAKKNTKKLDPVGKEDEDIDNDGKPNTGVDKYLKNRREKIKQSMMKKKKTLKEGTVIGNDNMQYGGFPRVVKLNEGGVVDQFNDADDKPGDEQVATHPDEITWNEKAYGTPYPSKSFAAVASAAIAAGDVVGKLHDTARTAMGPNYQQRGFLQDPAFLAARQQQLAAEAAMKEHPHYGEAQKGHPSKRRGPLTDEERIEMRGYGLPGSPSRWTGD